MTIPTEDPVLRHLVTRLSDQLDPLHGHLRVEPVQHGVKLVLDDGEGTAAGTLYHSAKKRRVSWVPNGKGSAKLAALLARTVQPYLGAAKVDARGKPVAAAEPEGAEAGYERWIGTDEAGKGDLFGPLVTGGFVADKEMVDELRRMGVRDSKELTRTQIRDLADRLQRQWPDRCAVVMIAPARYNEMYPDFAKKGGINGLLGWSHARAIRELAEGWGGVNGVVVDRFGGEHRLKAHLSKALKTLDYTIRPRAEDNLAVAAGAILARARYDRALDEMEGPLGFRPHAGSGAPAVKDLERLIRTGQELANYVKTHFGPVKQRGLAL